jgi:hypothetical protein
MHLLLDGDFSDPTQQIGIETNVLPLRLMEWRSMVPAQDNDKRQGNRAMIWVLVIGIPLCVEVAAWVVDATVVPQMPKVHEVWQEDDC